MTENSPAAVAGLQTGDVITEVDGQSVTSNSLVEAVANSVPGAALELTVYRQGAVMTVPVTVGEQIQPAMENGGTQQTLPSRGRNPFDR